MSFLDNVKAVPITDFADRIGLTVVRKGKYYSLKEHDSVIIDTDRNCFWRNSRFVMGSKGSAGSVIDFAIEFNGADDAKEAMKQIADMYGICGDAAASVEFRKPDNTSAAKKESRPAVGVVLPKKDVDNRCVYGYLLKTRCIDQSVIRYFLRKNMLYQDTHKNCVFHTGTTFGCVRGTDTTKRFVLDLEGNDYDECFYFRGNEKAQTLIVAEAVIDIMSIMSQFAKENVRYTDYCYLALTGTNKLQSVFYHIEQEQKRGVPIKSVLIATDADEKGEEAAVKIAEGLAAYGVEFARFAPPSGKDWNDFLCLCGG